MFDCNLTFFFVGNVFVLDCLVIFNQFIYLCAFNVLETITFFKETCIKGKL